MSSALGWILFGLLVAAGASRWMLVEAFPVAQSTLTSLALGVVWAALVSLLLLDWGTHPLRPTSTWRLDLLAGALLFAGPSIGMLLHVEALDAVGLTMALALTPVIVGVTTAALSGGGGEGAAGRIWPGMAAVGGLLLLLAEPNLSSAGADIGLALAPLLTGSGAALLCRPGQANSRRAIAALCGGIAVFVLALGASAVSSRTLHPPHWLAVASDGLLALLGVQSLLRIGALRWSAQFALLPLLIILESVVMVRPAVSARWIVGLAMLVLASFSLLLPPEDADSVSLHL